MYIQKNQIIKKEASQLYNIESDKLPLTYFVGTDLAPGGEGKDATKSFKLEFLG